MANLIECTSCDAGCQRCVSCESCNSCQKCVTCDVTCDVCQGTCNSSQSICETYTNVLSSYCGNTFSWQECTASGQTMGPGYFDKAEWDRICRFINQRAFIGSLYPGGSSFSNSATSNVAPFKASEFNRVANELNANNVVPKSIIYGSYFDDLKTAANRYRFYYYACDNCNTACNVTCEKCQGCNDCQKCNITNTDACTSCNNCESGNSREYCCSCDTCQSDNPEES